MDAQQDMLSRQKGEMDALHWVVHGDGNIIRQAKPLTKGSQTMDSRVSQLYMQLFHEIIRKRAHLFELSRLETNVLLATTELLRVTTSYREQKVAYVSFDLVNNHSVMATAGRAVLEDTFLTRHPVFPLLVWVRATAQS